MLSRWSICHVLSQCLATHLIKGFFYRKPWSYLYWCSDSENTDFSDKKSGFGGHDLQMSHQSGEGSAPANILMCLLVYNSSSCWWDAVRRVSIFQSKQLLTVSRWSRKLVRQWSVGTLGLDHPLSLLACQKKKKKKGEVFGNVTSPFRLSNIAPLLVVLLWILLAVFLQLSPPLLVCFSSVHPSTFSPNSNFSVVKCQASHLFCCRLTFPASPLPSTSHYLVYFCLLVSIHLRVLSNPLGTPACSPTFPSHILKTVLVTLYLKGCGRHCHWYAEEIYKDDLKITNENHPCF